MGGDSMYYRRAIYRIYSWGAPYMSVMFLFSAVGGSQKISTSVLEDIDWTEATPPPETNIHNSPSQAHAALHRPPLPST